MKDISVAEAVVTHLSQLDSEAWQGITLSSIILFAVFHYLQAVRHIGPILTGSGGDAPKLLREEEEEIGNQNFFASRREDTGIHSFFSNFNMDKLISTIKDVQNNFNNNNKSQKKSDGGVVDGSLKEILDVAFHLFEFVTSTNSLAEGTAARLGDVKDSTFAGTDFKSGGEDLKSDPIEGLISSDMVDMVSMARNAVRYITSLEKLVRFAQQA